MDFSPALPVQCVHGQRSQRSKFDPQPDIPGGPVDLSRICQRMSIGSLRTSGETIRGPSGANNPETIDELQLLDIPEHSAQSPGTSARGDAFWRSEIVGRVRSCVLDRLLSTTIAESPTPGRRKWSPGADEGQPFHSCLDDHVACARPRFT